MHFYPFFHFIETKDRNQMFRKLVVWSRKIFLFLFTASQEFAVLVPIIIWCSQVTHTIIPNQKPREYIKKAVKGVYRNKILKRNPWKSLLEVKLELQNVGLLLIFYRQKQPPRGVLKKRCSKNMQKIYRTAPMPKCDFNKVALQLYWNHTLSWVLSCKFAAYFQNTFS